MEQCWTRIWILGLLVSPALLNAQPSLPFTEYPIPTFPSSAHSITTGPDGALWFTEYFGNKIGRITTTGALTEYPVPTANSEPGGITLGPDGAIWFTETGGNAIGRITTTGAITEYGVPTAGASPLGITTGPDGALWFTERGNIKIGRITTTGAITEYTVPLAGVGPLGITAGPDGALWFTNWGDNNIRRITTAGAITAYPLPTANAFPTGITTGPDGALWFTESTGGKIGRITTTGTITEYPVPLGGVGPLGITTGPDGALWFSEGHTNNIGRITTAGAFTGYTLPTSGGPTNPFLLGSSEIPDDNGSEITVGPDGALWFTEQVTNNIGRAAISVAPPTISGALLPPGEVGFVYSTALSASGGTPPYGNWTVGSGSLPPGMALGPSTGAISGIPASVGTFSFSVTVKDSTGATSAAQSFSIGIAPPVQILGPTSLSSGTVGVPYPPPGGGGVTFSSTGGWNPQTWSATGLPNGMSMSAAGVLGGVPSAASQGTYNPQFTLRDSINATASVNLALTINVPGPSLQITTSSTLPAGTVGTFYSQTLTASGGLTPYSWSLISGALPSGLSLSNSGALTGTPTSTGTLSFTARVTDAASSSVTQTFSLTIGTSQPFTSALRVPQIVDGAGWKTRFAIINTDQVPVTFTFQFWGDNGIALPFAILNGPPGVLSGTLAPGASLFAQSPGTSSALQQGWAEVASSGRIGVTAIYQFSVGGPRDSLGTEIAALSGNSILMPFDNTQGNVTAVGIANTNPTQPLTVSMLFETDGGAQSTSLIVLSPHSHQAFVVPVINTAVAGFRGSIQFTAPSPDIAVMGLEFTSTGQFTSLGAFQ